MQPHLLILDADPIILKTLAYALTWKCKWRVSVAPNSETALSLLSQNDVNVFLCAAELTSASGIQVVKNMRQNGVKTPVVLMSDFPRGIDLKTTEHLEIVAVLPKPSDLDLLTKTLEQALSQNR